MCGLVGVIGNIIQRDQKVLSTLLILDQLRGKDSTGLAVVHKVDNEVEVLKAVGTPNFLFSHEQFDNKNMFIGAAPKVMIGHNRAATAGDVTDKNAHPFQHGHITGVHNGTLRYGTINRLENGNGFEVDSEAVIHNLFKNAKVKDTISKLAGAYTLIWYNSKEDKVYFIRNKDRPLFYCRSTDKDCFFWASESWMLRVALDRHDVKYEEIKSLPVDKLHSINIKKYDVAFRSVEMEEEEMIGGYIPIYNTHYHNSYQPYQHGYRVLQKATTKKRQDKIKGFTPSEIAFAKTFHRKNIEFIPKAVYKNSTKMGYVLAEMSTKMYYKGSPRDISIRLFVDKNPIRSELVQAFNKGIYKGFVKKVIHLHGNNRVDELYLLIDLRSVEYVKEKSPTNFFQQGLSDNTPTYTEGERGLLKGPHNSSLSIKAWETMTKSGCCYCGGGIEMKDANKIHWIGSEWCCEECFDTPFIQEYVYNNMQFGI